MAAQLLMVLKLENLKVLLLNILSILPSAVRDLFQGVFLEFLLAVPVDDFYLKEIFGAKQ